ncbi:hypothetical protein ACFV90_11835 [Streptomyces sp. NPDC059904]|uniref:hypothetical protein n=1 Tax=unclassified Streptomyces TaxID=2593676 RepID=UPI00365DBA69
MSSETATPSGSRPPALPSASWSSRRGAFEGGTAAEDDGGGTADQEFKGGSGEEDEMDEEAGEFRGW